MPGLDADTSSYALPTTPGPMDIAKGLGSLQQQQQQIQSGALTIDKQKLDLVNQQFGLMNSELSTLSADPSITKDQAKERLVRFSNTYKFPPEVTQHMITELDQSPDVKTFAVRASVRGLDAVQKLNQMYGANTEQTDNTTIRSGVTKPAWQGGGFTPSTETPIQVPPTQPSVNNQRLLPNGQPNPNYLQPGIVGPSGPPGVRPALPVNAAPQRPQAASLPISPSVAQKPAVSGPTGPSTQTGFNFNQRFAGEPIATGAPPGVASAIQAVGEQSGKDYATDLARAKNFQADIYPAKAALEGIEKLGVQGVGPGTDTLNNIKSAIITWLPNPDKEAIDKVGTFEQTRKYLTQIARSSGNTGTNDQLAAAFEGNPSVKLSQAATENVLKSVIALRRMQHAQTLLFGQQNLPPSDYSRWIAQNQNALDPRAFGFDLMDGDKKTTLLKSMAHQDKSGNWIANKSKEKEFNNFEQSLSFANDANLIDPPGRK